MTDTTYNYKVVRQFAIMTVVWGIVGMLVGVIAYVTLLALFLVFGKINPVIAHADVIQETAHPFDVDLHGQ